jgi:subtilase family serine protease
MKNRSGVVLLAASAALFAACGGHGNGFSPSLVSPLESAPLTPAVYAAGVKIAPDFSDFGRAPATLAVRLSVTLRYQHQPELDALVQGQSDPGSPYFRRYLTNAQFAAYFSPSIDAHRRVTQALTAAGLRIVRIFANRTVVEATGSSAAAERLFQTQIDYGIQAGHGRRYMNVRDAVMPAQLRDAVLTVSGLDDLISFAPRLQLAGPLRGPNGALGPLGFVRAYDEPAEHGYDGTGRAIANVIAGDISDNDLDHFLDYFGIKPKYALKRIAVDGGRAGFDDPETALDVETMLGTTPGAQVYLYSFPEFTDAYAEDAYNMIVDDNLVDVANSSWGGCEADRNRRLGHAFALASNAIFEQGAAKGITFPIATGDFGWKSCMHHDTIDETTADSDPYALAVGGTTLEVDDSANWVKETGWSGSAGGVSVVFARPAYQRRINNIVGAGRNLPDVALDANVYVTAFAARWHHIWIGAGGTSLASPLWVGLEGQIDEYLGSRIGFVNPQLYALLKGRRYASTFHDIVRGNNGGFRTLRGYDLVTGIGSPIGWPLAKALRQ